LAKRSKPYQHRCNDWTFTLKGITLPFISYGGTSVVFVMAAIGLVFQISRYTLLKTSTINKEGKQYEDRLDGRRLRGTYHSVASSRS